MDLADIPTQPLLLPAVPIYDSRPTLKQLREQHQMGQLELAEAAGIRVCWLHWMEMGIATEYTLVWRVLCALSRRTKIKYQLEDVRGVCIKDDASLSESITKISARQRHYRR